MSMDAIGKTKAMGEYSSVKNKTDISMAAEKKSVNVEENDMYIAAEDEKKAAP